MARNWTYKSYYFFANTTNVPLKVLALTYAEILQIFAGEPECPFHLLELSSSLHKNIFNQFSPGDFSAIEPRNAVILNNQIINLVNRMSNYMCAFQDTHLRGYNPWTQDPTQLNPQFEFFKKLYVIKSTGLATHCMINYELSPFYPANPQFREFFLECPSGNCCQYLSNFMRHIHVLSTNLTCRYINLDVYITKPPHFSPTEVFINVVECQKTLAAQAEFLKTPNAKSYPLIKIASDIIGAVCQLLSTHTNIILSESAVQTPLVSRMDVSTFIN